MKQFKFLRYAISILLVLSMNATVCAQDNIKLGAYYFDGWTGKTYHPTEKLRNDFPEREPIWGWITSTPEIIEKQINAAKSAGIDFFSFCWYYNPSTKGKDVAADPKNNALNLYRKASNKQKLEFNLLVANNDTYAIKASEWPELCNYWITLFKDPSYLKVDGKPLITIFDLPSFVKSFGTTDKASTALNTLRSMAVAAGLNGVSVAGNVGTNQTYINYSEKCGFDILTGYNYHNNGLQTSKEEVVDIDSMRAGEERVWNTMVEHTNKPIIPAITLNWDRRPWDPENVASQRFSGFSNRSVTKAIDSCRVWMQRNKSRVVKENIAILYAWNEYGEGAYLTPCKMGASMVDGVKKALLFQIPTVVDP